MRDKVIKVYDALDIHKLFDLIQADRTLLKMDLSKTNSNFGQGNFLLFDENEKYVCVSSSMHVILISLARKTFEKTKSFSIDPDQYR